MTFQYRAYRPNVFRYIFGLGPFIRYFRCPLYRCRGVAMARLKIWNIWPLGTVGRDISSPQCVNESMFSFLWNSFRWWSFPDRISGCWTNTAKRVLYTGFSLPGLGGVDGMKSSPGGVGGGGPGTPREDSGSGMGDYNLSKYPPRFIRRSRFIYWYISVVSKDMYPLYLRVYIHCIKGYVSVVSMSTYQLYLCIYIPCINV